MQGPRYKEVPLYTAAVWIHTTCIHTLYNISVNDPNQCTIAAIELMRLLMQIVNLPTHLGKKYIVQTN